MRSFIFACIAAVAIAVIAAFLLDSFVQEPVDVAFTTGAARI